MKTKEFKIKTGSVSLDADEFAPEHENVRISIVVPGKVIRAFKDAADVKHTKYQTLMNNALQAYADNLSGGNQLATKEELEILSRKLQQIANDLPTKKRA